jgi:MoaA/NifB/PqqE/SkfB family radical SAM enzyme
MSPAHGPSRALQIHPTRHCNLTCLHCYSLSGPDEREALAVELLLEAVADAKAEGYDAMSVSGGEPLLYRDLGRLLAGAKELGLFTAFTTNGMLLTERSVGRLAPVVDLVAVSIDGIGDSHDRMRNRAGAFSKMASRLEHLRNHGVRFGMLFTLTQFNVNELAAVAEFAVEQGAALLQVHPLHDAGAAVANLAGWAPDSREIAFATLEGLRFALANESRILVQVDGARRLHLLEHPEEVYAAGLPDGHEQAPLAELVFPLCIEASGRVTPLLHGFHPELDLGNLHDGGLRELAAGWRLGRCGDFYEHCRTAWETLADENAPALLSWYDELSHRPVSRPLTAV